MNNSNLINSIIAEILVKDIQVINHQCESCKIVSKGITTTWCNFNCTLFECKFCSHKMVLLDLQKKENVNFIINRGMPAPDGAPEWISCNGYTLEDFDRVYRFSTILNEPGCKWGTFWTYIDDEDKLRCCINWEDGYQEYDPIMFGLYYANRSSIELL